MTDNQLVMLSNIFIQMLDETTLQSDLLNVL